MHCKHIQIFRRVSELLQNIQSGRSRTLKLTIIRQRDKLEIVFKVRKTRFYWSKVKCFVFSTSFVRIGLHLVIVTSLMWTSFATCIKRSEQYWTKVVKLIDFRLHLVSFNKVYLFFMYWEFIMMRVDKSENVEYLSFYRLFLDEYLLNGIWKSLKTFYFLQDLHLKHFILWPVRPTTITG